MLRCAEHALFYLWQTRDLRLTCPTTWIQDDKKSQYSADLVYAQVLPPNESCPSPTVANIRPYQRVFDANTKDNTPQSTANGANTTTAISPSGPSDHIPLLKLCIQIHDFPDIIDFLSKPLDTKHFHHLRAIAMGAEPHAVPTQ